MERRRQIEMEYVNLSDIKGNQLQYIQVFYLLTSKYKKEICLLVANNYLTWRMAFFISHL